MRVIANIKLEPTAKELTVGESKDPHPESSPDKVSSLDGPAAAGHYARQRAQDRTVGSIHQALGIDGYRDLSSDIAFIAGSYPINPHSPRDSPGFHAL